MMIAGVAALIALEWTLFSNFEIRFINYWLPYHAPLTSLLALALMFLALRSWIRLMLGGERISTILEENPAPLSPSRPEPLASRLGFSLPVRVLVVDDDAGVRMVMYKKLSNLGVRATGVCDGVEALLAVADDRWDLVLMDGEMPFMDGIEAIRAIRHQNLLPVYTPIVTISANRSQDYRQACVDAGTTACRPKPRDTRDLEALMDEFL
jgi:CheY-like chemotaxis protein